MSEQPFEGVRVVELAQWVFVPVAGALRRIHVMAATNVAALFEGRRPPNALNAAALAI